MVDATPATSFDADASFMERALFLAERGRGTTSPNPMVGAVVVSGIGVIVGQGAHIRPGGAHAEVAALDMAGERARGSTLYCTLEPCAHIGRTGPCVERIVAAGISRVVAAMTDPDPRVSGRGFEYLRAHGISVTVGVGETAATALNAPFLTWVTKRRPYVIAKTAISADGFVGVPGARALLTGDEANRYFHRQRAEVDAIAVGAGTILTDDPELTVRHVRRDRALLRVIVDWRARVPAGARLFSTLSQGPVIMAVTRETAATRQEAVAALWTAGATIELFDNPDIPALLARLAEREVTLLLVEGGPSLQRAFFEAGVIDRVQRVESPKRLKEGIPAAAGFTPPEDAVTHMTTLGADRLVEWHVHRTD
jgi:diaminohydroxyphosphoribosylaminopyrimidine deaminase/5-amino-6-(5-phosphoribosylamino)uracil reductase